MKYKLVLFCRFFMYSSFYLSIKQIFAQYLLRLRFITASYISRLPVHSCFSIDLPSSFTWIPLLPSIVFLCTWWPSLRKKKKKWCLLYYWGSNMIVLVCFAAITNYNKLSWLKEHKFYILPFWRSDVKKMGLTGLLVKSRCWLAGLRFSWDALRRSYFLSFPAFRSWPHSLAHGPPP